MTNRTKTEATELLKEYFKQNPTYIKLFKGYANNDDNQFLLTCKDSYFYSIIEGKIAEAIFFDIVNYPKSK